MHMQIKNDNSFRKKRVYIKLNVCFVFQDWGLQKEYTAALMTQEEIDQKVFEVRIC
mgnify:CR=1 FL=1